MAFEGRSVTAVTHAGDQNGLLALTLCPGSCPAACSDPAGPRAPAAAARLWHPQPWVPCGAGALLSLLPSRCRGGHRCFPSLGWEIPPALPGAPKRSVWLPASPRSSSRHASPSSLPVACWGPGPRGSAGPVFGSPCRSGEPVRAAAPVLSAGWAPRPRARCSGRSRAGWSCCLSPQRCRAPRPWGGRCQLSRPHPAAVLGRGRMLQPVRPSLSPPHRLQFL